MAKKNSFINQFLEDKKTIGSIIPSSRFLAKRMIENVDFKKDKILVELGPGTGVFTFEIIKMMAPDATLLIFELNTVFIRNLRRTIKDPRVIFINDSAEKVDEYLKNNNLDKADVIFSSLPLSNFSRELKESIITNSFNSLKNYGKFIQFQYSLSSIKLFQTIFNEVNKTFTLLNFPPAFVFTCEKIIDTKIK
jgi:phosphatidylethanolamine/phosphatidyl-N-methylethanolamine N-methyltransferase